METDAEYHDRRALQEWAMAAACRDCISRSEHEELAELHDEAAATSRGGTPADSERTSGAR